MTPEHMLVVLKDAVNNVGPGLRGLNSGLTNVAEVVGVSGESKTVRP